MPLADIGSLVLHHIVFLTHLVYINIAFSFVEPGLLVGLYFVFKLIARGPEDLDPPVWPPKW